MTSLVRSGAGIEFKKEEGEEVVDFDWITFWIYFFTYKVQLAQNTAEGKRDDRYEARD